MLRKNRTVISIGAALLLASFFYWNFYTYHTGAVVELIENSSDLLLVQDESGNLKTINTSIDLSQITMKNKKYFISYEHRKWETPRLLSISPI